MDKILKGWELLKEIEEGRIKEGSEFRVSALPDNEFIKYFGGDKFEIVDANSYVTNPVKACWFIGTEFELINKEPSYKNKLDIVEHKLDRIIEMLKEQEV